MLDGGGQAEDVCRAVEEPDGTMWLVLDEPLVGRQAHHGVDEVSADQDSGPGSRLSGQVPGRGSRTGNHICLSVRGWWPGMPPGHRE
ncbi:hypothetical protein QR97_31575 [Streptomyces sp. PBH53]|nr:hypothetical protein QR97_31575 [Streptomyces sp. PBH53]